VIFLNQGFDIILFAKEWGGWIVGIITVAAMVIIHLYGRQVVRISCILGQPISLISVRKEVKDQIKIYYKDKAVENLTLIRVKVRNEGNTPIRREHIVKSIEFDFGENSGIIDYSIISTNPEGIKVQLKPEENSIKCYFDLLNPKDEITLQFVCLGNIVKPKVSARIEGLKQIEVLPEEKAKKSTQIGIIYMIIGASMIAISGINLGKSDIGLILFSYGEF